MQMWTNIPNILTLARLVAAPGVVVMFLYFNRPWADWFALLLFVMAAMTDLFDGHLARAWKQETLLGAILDPIADKAMVVIALCVITGFSGMDPWILLPTTVILFREVLVSGLREFLGAKLGTLKVTQFAKWKTTTQMIAIATLFATGIFVHELKQRTQGTQIAQRTHETQATHRPVASNVVEGTQAGEQGLWPLAQMAEITWWAGTVLLWIAAVLTLITGVEYLRRALPYLRGS